jgi:endonuclease/exonuclease/phosphatase family metal-dependent hydrolase
MYWKCQRRRWERGLLVVWLFCSIGFCTGDCRGEEQSATEHRDRDGRFVAMTFNTGTTLKLPNSEQFDDGYGAQQAAFSDRWYGNGLAWKAAVDAVRKLIRQLNPDVVAFQEMYFPEEGETIPAEARTGFVAPRSSPDDPTVAQSVLGDDYQIAYHPGKPNKCLGVRRSFGTIRGYDEHAAVNWLEGAPVKGCGGGSRVARAWVDRPGAESINVICLHGTSGLKPADQACRSKQVERIFVDFGDGLPGVRGERNLILGDFNTDPGRVAAIDASARRWNDFVGSDKPFHFLSKTGAGAPRAYQGIADIDHIVSDAFRGECQCIGVDEGTKRVWEGVYFDHVPVVCTIEE